MGLHGVFQAISVSINLDLQSPPSADHRHNAGQVNSTVEWTSPTE